MKNKVLIFLIDIAFRMSVLGQYLLVKTVLYISTMTILITLCSLGGVLLLELMRKYRSSRAFSLIMVSKYILDVYTGVLICDLAGWEYWVAFVWTLIDAILVDRVGRVFFYYPQTKGEKAIARIGACVWLNVKCLWLKIKYKLSVIGTWPILDCS